MTSGRPYFFESLNPPRSEVNSARLRKLILYVQYTNPGAYPPLEHSSRILADRGWKVHFLGTGSQGANALQFEPYRNIAVNKMRFCPAGWKQKLHYAAYCFWVLGWALFHRPRWVYASDPLSCPVALLLSFIPGVRVIYHEHDSPAEQRGDGSETWVSRSRRWLASRAKACILPNYARGEIFRAQVGRSINLTCVWNCPGSYEALETEKDTKNDFWILYHGSIVPERLPLSVLEALGRVPESIKLRIVGYETAGSAGYVDEIIETSKRLGIRHRLQIIISVPTRDALLALCRECHVGLSLMPMSTSDVNMEQMVGASNKPFDYLACGLALLVSDLPEWRDTYVEAGYGLTCIPEQIDSIASALEWFWAHRESTREMGRRGRERILAEWNYERQFAPVLNMLESA